ncbi:MAG: hypothetical protein IT244_12055 [Bacteroidia bacterium]|nr:hypothetical protein [Bacteroidia bacterium]
MNTTKGLVLLAVMLPVMAMSCKKPVTPDDPKDTSKGITLQFESKFDGTPIEYTTGVYTRSNNEVMLFTNWAMILSHVSLVKTDNTKVQLGDGYLFIDFAGKKTKYNFPTSPAGDYKGISFKLGLDSLINHGDPAAWPGDHPLNGNYTGLHWGWSTGYIFQAIDGRYKKQASDADWLGLSLHTATDIFPKDFMLPLNFSLSENGHKTATIEGWADEYFKNPTLISFVTDGSFSHSVGASEISLMQAIMGNSDDVFKLTQVK